MPDTTRWGRAACVVLVCATFSCGSCDSNNESATPQPKWEVTASGEGAMPDQPLLPLRSGSLWRGGLVSPVTLDGRELVSWVIVEGSPGWDAMYLEASERGVLWAGNPRDGLFDAPVMLVPNEVRDGMMWRSEAGRQGTFEARARVISDVWTIEVDYTNRFGAEVSRTLDLRPGLGPDGGDGGRTLGPQLAEDAESPAPPVVELAPLAHTLDFGGHPFIARRLSAVQDADGYRLSIFGESTVFNNPQDMVGGFYSQADAVTCATFDGAGFSQTENVEDCPVAAANLVREGGTSFIPARGVQGLPYRLCEYDDNGNLVYCLYHLTSLFTDPDGDPAAVVHLGDSGFAVAKYEPTTGEKLIYPERTPFGLMGDVLHASTRAYNAFLRGGADTEQRIHRAFARPWGGVLAFNRDPTPESSRVHAGGYFPTLSTLSDSGGQTHVGTTQSGLVFRVDVDSGGTRAVPVAQLNLPHDHMLFAAVPYGDKLLVAAQEGFRGYDSQFDSQSGQIDTGLRPDMGELRLFLADVDVSVATDVWGRAADVRLEAQVTDGLVCWPPEFGEPILDGWTFNDLEPAGVVPTGESCVLLLRDWSSVAEGTEEFEFAAEGPVPSVGRIRVELDAVSTLNMYEPVPAGPPLRDGGIIGPKFTHFAGGLRSHPLSEPANTGSGLELRDGAGRAFTDYDGRVVIHDGTTLRHIEHPVDGLTADVATAAVGGGLRLDDMLYNPNGTTVALQRSTDKVPPDRDGQLPVEIVFEDGTVCGSGFVEPPVYDNQSTIITEPAVICISPNGAESVLDNPLGGTNGIATADRVIYSVWDGEALGGWEFRYRVFDLETNEVVETERFVPEPPSSEGVATPDARLALSADGQVYAFTRYGKDVDIARLTPDGPQHQPLPQSDWFERRYEFMVDRGVFVFTTPEESIGSYPPPFTLRFARGAAADAQPTNNCNATTEVCNGVDDDCDGDVDEAGAELSCSFANAASPACVAGACALGVCQTGFDDCDQMASNGCEAVLGSHATCGGCGDTCEVGAACLSAACTQPVAAIAAGENSTCASLSSGDVWCWGANSVFIGSAAGPVTEPVAVAVHSGADVRFGEGHGCSLLAGELSCWGRNVYGQAVPGEGNSVAVPMPVAGLGTVVDFDLGEEFTCALNNADEVYCWGRTTEGRLGDGNENDGSGGPQLVSGLAGVAQVVLGRAHACVRHADGNVSCWGAASRGQLGGASSVTRNGVQAVEGLTGVDELWAGWDSTWARSGSTTFGWGDNSGYALADGTTESLARVPVTIPALTGASGASGHALRSCVVVGDGSLVCWGLDEGETAPTEVLPPGDALAVSVGTQHVCAVSASLGAVCWGSGAGVGNFDGRAVPEPRTVVGLP